MTSYLACGFAEHNGRTCADCPYTETCVLRRKARALKQLEEELMKLSPTVDNRRFIGKRRWMRFEAILESAKCLDT